jgi:hypothetical protein
MVFGRGSIPRPGTQEIHHHHGRKIMSVNVEDIVTPKLAHSWAWHVRMAEGAGRGDEGHPARCAGRVEGFQDAVGLILGVAPELVGQILAVPEFRDWWRNESEPEVLLAEALNKLVSLKRPSRSVVPPSSPQEMAASMVLDYNNGDPVARTRWDDLVASAGLANAWATLGTAVVRANTGIGLQEAVARAHEIVDATL